MFYATIVNEIGDRGVIDAQGKRLTFIGNLPVKVGDTVYTDGYVVFGNVPRRGSINYFIEKQRGIPVLGVDFDSGAELRGYFTSSGKFKPYSIAGVDWIVNSKNAYAHDFSYDENEILDAYISDDGVSFLATGGIYKKSQELDIHYPLESADWTNGDVLEWRDYADAIYTGYAYEMPSHTYPAPLILGSANFGNSNIPLKIFKNDGLYQSFDLETYGDDIESRALQCADEILSQSYNYTDADNAVPFSLIAERKMLQYRTIGENLGFPDYVNAVYMPDDALTRPDTFIAHTSAHILTCNVNENGFTATVFATSYGYCFPYIQPRFLYSVMPASVADNPNTNLREVRNIQEWKCVPFGASAIYIISDGELEKVVATRKFGGLDSDLIIPVDNMRLGNTNYLNQNHNLLNFQDVATTRHIELLPDNVDSDDYEFSLPVGDGFFSFNKYGLISFYDAEHNEIATDIPIDKFLRVEAQAAVFSTHYDDRYYSLYISYSIGKKLAFNDKPDFIRLKLFDTSSTEQDFNCTLNPQIAVISHTDTDAINLDFLENHQARDDGYQYTLDSDWYGHYSSANRLPPFDAFYQSDGEELKNLHFTPLFYDFKNGNYLYGVKDGNLYFQSRDDSGKISVTQVGRSPTKNFRLCELENFSVAKV